MSSLTEDQVEEQSTMEHNVVCNSHPVLQINQDKNIGIEEEPKRKCLESAPKYLSKTTSLTSNKENKTPKLKKSKKHKAKKKFYDVIPFTDSDESTEVITKADCPSEVGSYGKSDISCVNQSDIKTSPSLQMSSAVSSVSEEVSYIDSLCNRLDSILSSASKNKKKKTQLKKKKKTKETSNPRNLRQSELLETNKMETKENDKTGDKTRISLIDNLCMTSTKVNFNNQNSSVHSVSDVLPDVHDVALQASFSTDGAGKMSPKNEITDCVITEVPQSPITDCVNIGCPPYSSVSPELHDVSLHASVSSDGAGKISPLNLSKVSAIDVPVREHCVDQYTMQFCDSLPANAKSRNRHYSSEKDLFKNIEEEAKRKCLQSAPKCLSETTSLTSNQENKTPKLKKSKKNKARTSKKKFYEVIPFTDSDEFTELNTKADCPSEVGSYGKSDISCVNQSDIKTSPSLQMSSAVSSVSEEVSYIDSLCNRLDSILSSPSKNKKKKTQLKKKTIRKGTSNPRFSKANSQPELDKRETRESAKKGNKPKGASRANLCATSTKVDCSNQNLLLESDSSLHSGKAESESLPIADKPEKVLNMFEKFSEVGFELSQNSACGTEHYVNVRDVSLQASFSTDDAGNMSPENVVTVCVNVNSSSSQVTDRVKIDTPPSSSRISPGECDVSLQASISTDDAGNMSPENVVTGCVNVNSPSGQVTDRVKIDTPPSSSRISPGECDVSLQASISTDDAGNMSTISLPKVIETAETVLVREQSFDQNTGEFYDSIPADCKYHTRHSSTEKDFFKNLEDEAIRKCPKSAPKCLLETTSVTSNKENKTLKLKKSKKNKPRTSKKKFYEVISFTDSDESTEGNSKACLSEAGTHGKSDVNCVNQSDIKTSPPSQISSAVSSVSEEAGYIDSLCNRLDSILSAVSNKKKKKTQLKKKTKTKETSNPTHSKKKAQPEVDKTETMESGNKENKPQRTTRDLSTTSSNVEKRNEKVVNIFDKFSEAGFVTAQSSASGTEFCEDVCPPQSLLLNMDRNANSTDVHGNVQSPATDGANVDAPPSGSDNLPEVRDVALQASFSSVDSGKLSALKLTDTSRIDKYENLPVSKHSPDQYAEEFSDSLGNTHGRRSSTEEDLYKTAIMESNNSTTSSLDATNQVLTNADLSRSSLPGIAEATPDATYQTPDLTRNASISSTDTGFLSVSNDSTALYKTALRSTSVVPKATPPVRFHSYRADSEKVFMVSSDSDEDFRTPSLQNFASVKKKNIRRVAPIVISDSDNDDDDELESFLDRMKTPAKKVESDDERDEDFVVSDSEISSSGSDSDFSFNVNTDRKFDTPLINRIDSKRAASTKVAEVFKTPRQPPVKPKPFTTQAIPKHRSVELPDVGTPHKVTENVKTTLQHHRLNSTGHSPQCFSFLKSLSADVPDSKRDPEAGRFVKNFKKLKEELTKKLFKLFNDTVFDNKLPVDLAIEWNTRLTKTAGYCRYRKDRSVPNGKTAKVELSVKVIDSADRLRDTLIHELCHAVVWLVHGLTTGHGTHWKAWAVKAMKIHRELPVISRCHEYKITTKYSYRCTKCGYTIGRHSKSLDTEKKVCGYCRSPFELLVKTKDGNLATPQSVKKTPNRFALFVKDRYGSAKREQPNLKHSDVMRQLSAEFAAMNKISE